MTDHHPDGLDASSLLEAVLRTGLIYGIVLRNGAVQAGYLWLMGEPREEIDEWTRITTGPACERRPGDKRAALWLARLVPVAFGGLVVWNAWLLSANLLPLSEWPLSALVPAGLLAANWLWLVSFDVVVMARAAAERGVTRTREVVGR